MCGLKLFFVTAFILGVTQGIVYDRCGLARELNGLGVAQGNTLDTYVCIALHESSYNTDAVGPPNTDGSSDYGIFQINNAYWCSDGRFPSSNGCNVRCQDLLGQRGVKRSLQCAELVKRKQGWSAWTTYYKCTNPQSNADCFRNSGSSGLWGTCPKW